MIRAERTTVSKKVVSMMNSWGQIILGTTFLAGCRDFPEKIHSPLGDFPSGLACKFARGL